MADEYGKMDASGETFRLSTFKLESGTILREVEVRYRTWGTLNASRDNAVVVCHALTGNASLDSWWGGLLGSGKPFDTDKYFIICANALGSCYGTTGPTSIDPTTKLQYGGNFPFVTVRDSVRLHAHMVKDGLGVSSIKSAIGGSMGGMQVLEWLFMGDLVPVRSAVAIACGSHHHAWQIAISEAQRAAIYADPKFLGGSYDKLDPPYGGLSVARQIAMVSYRTHQAYEDKFGRKRAKDASALDSLYSVETYLRHQGQKFLSRFDPNSYIAITRLMDSHDVGRNRGGEQQALASAKQPTLVIGIDSDVLYPVTEQKALAKMLPSCEDHYIRSDEGHDGFLLEQDAIGSLIQSFLSRHL
ncbi:hypothetical protein CYMTET_5535 [Cymbomonas tetramitiformis]|uniref:AB hydrolase-1 domain-containing protein n=1 Tax=Cymbomonas tetramitiformis TaxID=36881 RepID=A0AAE0GZ94_9CHLO|nr:hypothetical protein CYMTET_5535 [Cymbomonas tetramitiformis]